MPGKAVFCIAGPSLGARGPCLKGFKDPLFSLSVRDCSCWRQQRQKYSSKLCKTLNSCGRGNSKCWVMKSYSIWGHLLWKVIPFGEIKYLLSTPPPSFLLIPAKKRRKKKKRRKTKKRQMILFQAVCSPGLCELSVPCYCTGDYCPRKFRTSMTEGRLLRWSSLG